MLPTLKPGQDVLVFNWVYLFSKPKIGDMVVIKVDVREMVKRISKINDRQKMIYVLGDNEKESTDSRKFGLIDKSQIIGKVIWYQ